MAKKPKSKNKVPSKKWAKYKVDGDKLVRAKMCPKCNVFLGEHNDRFVCGKCGYMEIKKKE